MSEVAVRTQGCRAGFTTRGVAFTIDFFMVLAAYPLTMWTIGLVMGVLDFSAPEYPNLDDWLDALIQLMIMFWYFVGPWAISGRTLGQAVMGLRVVSRHRRRVGVPQATVRWAVLFLTLLWIGPLWLLFSRQRLALHDVAARTQVIYDRAPRRTAVSVALSHQPAPTPSPT